MRVPDRPRSVDGLPIPGSDDGSGNEVIDTKDNGSITVRWQGSATDVQGIVTGYQTPASNTSKAISYAFLLPPGAGS